MINCNSWVKNFNGEIDPIDGPGIEKMVNGLCEIEPAVVNRVKQIVEAK